MLAGVGVGEGVGMGVSVGIGVLVGLGVGVGVGVGRIVGAGVWIWVGTGCGVGVVEISTIGFAAGAIAGSGVATGIGWARWTVIVYLPRVVVTFSGITTTVISLRPGDQPRPMAIAPGIGITGRYGYFCSRVGGSCNDNHIVNVRSYSGGV